MRGAATPTEGDLLPHTHAHTRTRSPSRTQGEAKRGLCGRPKGNPCFPRGPFPHTHGSRHPPGLVGHRCGPGCAPHPLRGDVRATDGGVAGRASPAGDSPDPPCLRVMAARRRCAGTVGAPLPPSFGAAPVTEAEAEAWIGMCRDALPGVLARTRRDAEGFVPLKTVRGVEISKYGPPVPAPHCAREGVWGFGRGIEAGAGRL